MFTTSESDGAPERHNYSYKGKPYLEYARYVLRIFRIIVARKCIVNLKKRNNFSFTFQGLVKISIKSKKIGKRGKG